ncbi:MAG: glycosyltransferase family 39 protein [Gaiellaceae bacterium]
MSAVLRFVAALPHRTITYYPDEYIYSALAHSFATTGHFTIRGAPAHFPPLLESIVTAPLWIGSDPALSMRLTQALHAIVMSLAAVPVYLLARQLRLGAVQALAAAAFTLALPDIFFVDYLTADALAFTLAISAVAVGVRALAAPTWKGDLAFIVLAGLATFARLQYVVLLGAFAVAAVVVSGRHAPRRHPLTAGVLGACLALLAALGVHSALGYYEGISAFGVSPAQMIRWMGTDSALLAFVAGGAVVPGAVAGVALAFGRKRPPEQRAFAALVTALALGLLLEAGLYATNGSPRFQERYLMAILPFLPLAFCLALRFGRKAVLVALPVAGAIAIFAARVPLSRYSLGNMAQDSTFMGGQRQLGELLGVSSAALVTALIVTVLVVAGAVAVARPRLALPLLAASVLFGAAFSALTSARHLEHVVKVARTYIPSDPRWIDHAELGHVALIVPATGPRELGFESLFWNRSLTGVYLFPGAAEVDAFRSGSAGIASDGRLLVDGHPLREAFELEEYQSLAQLSGAALVKRTLTASLWQPRGTPRVDAWTNGLYFDGWLAATGSTTVWPLHGRNNGVYLLRLGLPWGASGNLRVMISAPHYRKAVTLVGRRYVTVRIPFSGRGRWTVRFRALTAATLADGRRVSGFAPVAPRIVRVANPGQ